MSQPAAKQTRRRTERCPCENPLKSEYERRKEMCRFCLGIIAEFRGQTELAAKIRRMV